MTPNRQREIVIEFERVQTIRKRAKTVLAHCIGCQAEKDFVTIVAAAELFGIDADQLGAFATENEVHLGSDGSQICVSSLLEIMRKRQLQNGVRMIGNGDR